MLRLPPETSRRMADDEAALEVLPVWVGARACVWVVGLGSW